MTTSAPAGVTGVLDEAVLAAVRSGADTADAEAVFPKPAFAALRAAGLVRAAIPRELGGLGLSLGDCVRIAEQLSRACGATAMIWVMHQAQIACVLAGEPSELCRTQLRELADSQGLIASVTSEIGIGGDIRTSSAALRATPESGRHSVAKKSPTVSYGEYAEAVLLTCRRTPDSPADDQVAVFVPRDQVRMQRHGRWDPMGMRGTVSPPFTVTLDARPDQVLTLPFDRILGRAMVPWSHTLWAACWYGSAAEAVARARRVLRAKGAAEDGRLGEVVRALAALEALVEAAVRHSPAPDQDPSPVSTAWFNDLKLTASDQAVAIATASLEICGMPGFQERGPHSIARILRDLHSAPLMVGNDRLRRTNARYAIHRGR
ncbi:acyl-CoA dehydrogenase family protein [Nocardia takedensis]